MIKIVTDSVSDIPVDLAQELDIEILPLTVNFEGQSYKDGIEMTTEDFFERIKRSDTLPTTSQVAPREFLKVFEKIASKGDSIIAILMSSELSGTYTSAMTAKNLLGYGDIDIIDSRGVTFGYGLIVIEAARMAQKGWDKQKILDRITYMKENMVYKFVVDTLENLYKGGRLNASRAFIGNLLNIKPILTMKDGKLVLEDKVRGRKKALKWIVNWIKSHHIDLSQQTIGINHSNDEAYAEELIEMIKNNFSVKEILTSKVGCVVGTHAGPGAVAIYFLKEQK